MDPSLDAGDEVKLPGPPLHLPGSEPDEDADYQGRTQAEEDQR
jgi:hypothetical protein